MPNYKLIYFNSRGRAEFCRLILHCANVPFEDFRIERGLHGEWPAMKHSIPFGQVPVLEIDGTNMLAQSNAIARYLARQHGLAGRDEWEQSQADMFVDNVHDLSIGMWTLAHEKDAEKQAEIFSKVNEEVIQPNVKMVEQFLIKNGTGFLIGKEVTWADIAYYAFFTTPTMERLGGHVLDDHPNLKKLVQLVGDIPSIKKYVDSRPEGSA